MPVLHGASLWGSKDDWEQDDELGGHRGDSEQRWCGR